MAGFTQAHVTKPGLAPAQTAQAWPTPSARPRRRRISPESGKALEKLGHAIEYLTDEFVHEGGSFSASHPQMQAIQLLMAVNRQIYMECPEVPTLGERFLALLHA